MRGDCGRLRSFASEGSGDAKSRCWPASMQIIQGHLLAAQHSDLEVTRIARLAARIGRNELGTRWAGAD